MKAKIIFLSLLVSAALVSCSKAGDLTVQKAMDEYKRQNYDNALSLFMQASEEETNYSRETLYTFISTIYTMQEEYEKAIDFQKKSLELKKDYRTIISLAMNYHLLKKDNEAESVYKDAIALAPKKAEAYAMLGALYLGQDNTARAIENLEKAREITPQLSVVHANLAVAYAKAGDFDKSDESIAKAKELKCENIEIFMQRIKEIKEQK